MDEHRLLELAAKAAGWAETTIDERGWFRVCVYTGEPREWEIWNPLIDDGDALRLAVKLNIAVFPYDDETSTGTVGVVSKNWCSKEENTRRAIVRAAAAIGERMETDHG